MHGSRPAVQRAVLLVIALRTFHAGSLFHPERPEAFERALAIPIEEIARQQHQAHLIPDGVLIAQRRSRVSGRGVPIEVVEARVSAQADHEVGS